jgi:Ca2+/Na+ antiporter
MAINNAIGSNVFDILIGIGFPFLLLSVIENHSVDVISGNLWVSFALLFGSVILLAATFLLNRWRTSKMMGSLLIVLYIVYLVYEILKIY